MATRGRPRSFDRTVALRHAMEVFWAKGYDGAPLNEVMATMGLNPPSFYAAFGSKEALFREAVDLYIETVAAAPMKALEEAKTLQTGLRAMFEGSIEVALSRESIGCLLILGVVNWTKGSEAARDYLKQARRNTVKLIRTRLKRGVADRELPKSTDIDALATYYHGIIQAISFQARDGASRRELTLLASTAMAAIHIPINKRKS